MALISGKLDGPSAGSSAGGQGHGWENRPLSPGLTNAMRGCEHGCGKQRGCLCPQGHGRLRRRSDVWQKLRGCVLRRCEQSLLKARQEGCWDKHKNEKTRAIPPGQLLRSLETQSVNSWASLSQLRPLAAHSTCKVPRGSLSRKFCVLLLTECVLGPVCVCVCLLSGVGILSLLLCANMRTKRQQQLSDCNSLAKELCMSYQHIRSSIRVLGRGTPS